MSKIVILSGNHLCHNPRVLKEADALSDGGHTVEVLGGWIDPALAERDKELLSTRSWIFTPVVNASASALSGRLRWKRARLARSVAERVHRYAGLENVLQLGYGWSSLLAAARSRSADLFIAHSEAGLAVADRLQRDGAKV